MWKSHEMSQLCVPCVYSTPRGILTSSRLPFGSGDVLHTKTIRRYWRRHVALAAVGALALPSATRDPATPRKLSQFPRPRNCRLSLFIFQLSTFLMQFAQIYISSILKINQLCQQLFFHQHAGINSSHSLIASVEKSTYKRLPVEWHPKLLRHVFTLHSLTHALCCHVVYAIAMVICAQHICAVVLEYSYISLFKHYFQGSKNRGYTISKSPTLHSYDMNPEVDY